jgi:hypothetical protein
MRNLRLVLALCVLMLVLVPTAYAAGGSAGTGYGGVAGNVQQQASGNVAGIGATASKGTLPFTGLDLALLVAGGTVLLVVGAGMRRAARRNA